MIEASWRMSGIFKADANKVYHEIKSMGEEVTPNMILDKAKDPGTELHKCFEWDNTVAAEKWRLHQARNITVQLVILQKEPEKPPIRIFSKSETTSAYKETVKIVQNNDEYKKLLSMAYAELKEFKRKYASLKELDYILSLID